MGCGPRAACAAMPGWMPDGFAALEHAAFARLAGEGVLAITIEPKRGGQTYQGIVELSPDGLAASAETYFAQSEQLPTVIRLAAAPLYVAGEKTPRWRAAGLMLQMTPEASKAPGSNEDDWNRLSLLARTVEDLELVDTGLPPETVLWRLFHEDEVRVQPAEPVLFRCDCDASRIVSVLQSYAPEERAAWPIPTASSARAANSAARRMRSGPTRSRKVACHLTAGVVARAVRSGSRHANAMVRR